MKGVVIIETYLPHVDPEKPMPCRDGYEGHMVETALKEMQEKYG